MAIDGHRSTFVGGGSIDQFVEMVDLSPNEKILATRWQTLKLQESLTSAEQIEFNNLTTQLSNKIFSAEKFNTLADCIVALEIFFRDNVEGYIETKQQEFDATLQKFSDQGTYNNTFNYMQWNTILYNYEGYISRKDNNLNHTPIGDETDIWWQKIAQRGRQGQPGLGLRFTGLFSISKTYSENDAVAYYGDDGYTIYYCLSSCMGIEPTDENYWAVFMSLAQLSSIIGDTNDLLTEDKSSLVNAFNEVFLSVSSGKTQLETAITDMRGAVSKEKEIVSFNELESGVRSIPISKGTALPEHVLDGETFTNNDGIEYTGTMPNRGAVNHSLPINGSFTISQGCHNGLGKVTQSIPTKGAATYNPSQSDQIITSGQYLYDNQTIKAVTFDASKVLEDITIAGKAGTMSNQGAKVITPSTANQAILGGYHNGSGYVKGDANLVPANIKKGISIFGKAGTSFPKKSFGQYLINLPIDFGAGCFDDYEDVLWARSKPYGYKLHRFNSGGVLINSITMPGQFSRTGNVINISKNHMVVDYGSGAGCIGVTTKTGTELFYYSLSTYRTGAVHTDSNRVYFEWVQNDDGYQTRYISIYNLSNTLIAKVQLSTNIYFGSPPRLYLAPCAEGCVFEEILTDSPHTIRMGFVSTAGTLKELTSGTNIRILSTALSI